MWDFITPSDTEEEQNLVEKTCKKCVRGPDDENFGETEEVILRAWFSEQEPATCKWFIAQYGTMEETTGVSSFALVL